jgi:hypothetical protein
LRILLLIISLLFADPAISQQSGPREPERKAETAQQPQQSGYAFYGPAKPFSFSVFEKSVAPIVNIYTGKHAGEKSQCAQPQDWKEWGSFAWCRSVEWIDTDRVIAIWTVVLGIATCVLGIATVKLWRATDRLVESAEGAAQRQLQAYLSITKARIDDVEIGKQPIVKFKIGNAGQTPAYDLWAEMVVDCQMFQLPKGVNIILQPAREISRITISPKMKIIARIAKNEPLSSIQLDQIRNKQIAIYVIGKIRYTDAFGCGWLQNLRLMYNWRGLETSTRKLEVCEEGNDIKQISGPPLT